MLYFPQLSSGATAQFPMLRRELKRTVINAAFDGREIKLADPTWSRVEWSLRFQGLTDDEWNAIEALFTAVEGRLGSFTFLDPADNLISSSEDLSAPVWSTDPTLQLTPGTTDPFGSPGATTIASPGSGTASIEQGLNLPAWFQYCFSAYIRSDSPGDVSLYRRAGGVRAGNSFQTSAEWQRIEYASKLADPTESVVFGLELRGTQTMDVFGFQLETQVGASAYKKTVSRGGIYTEARFVEDGLQLTTEAPHSHSCTLRIRARAQG